MRSPLGLTAATAAVAVVIVVWWWILMQHPGAQAASLERLSLRRPSLDHPPSILLPRSRLLAPPVVVLMCQRPPPRLRRHHVQVPQWRLQLIRCSTLPS